MRLLTTDNKRLINKFNKKLCVWQVFAGVLLDEGCRWIFRCCSPIFVRKRNQAVNEANGTEAEKHPIALTRFASSKVIDFNFFFYVKPDASSFTLGLATPVSSAPSPSSSSFPVK